MLKNTILGPDLYKYTDVAVKKVYPVIQNLASISKRLTNNSKCNDHNIATLKVVNMIQEYNRHSSY